MLKKKKSSFSKVVPLKSNLVKKINPNVGK